jgi:hypothetical protein
MQISLTTIGIISRPSRQQQHPAIQVKVFPQKWAGENDLVVFHNPMGS